jgi:thiol:disulfide interchange protein
MKNIYKKLSIATFVTILVLLAFGFVFKKDSAAENNSNKPEKGIVFIEADWDKAKTEARKQNKLIFLDAYTTWCGPCKLLKRKTFPDEEVGALFNNNFINVAIDMEKGHGPMLTEKYGVYAYPTLLILDADGKMVTYTQGFMKPKDLIEFGKHGLSLK